MSVYSVDDKYYNTDDPSSRMRMEFYSRLPKGGVVAEIGVWYGKNARLIYHTTKPEHLYLIDTWVSITKPGDVKVRTEYEWNDMFRLVCEYFGDKPVTVIRKGSVETAESFDDEFFDWVYVDAGHSFDSCYTDLRAWYPKVKRGGYICGHDYCETTANLQKSFGVKKAVDQFMNENALQTEFLSRNAKAVDYAIKKP